MQTKSSLDQKYQPQTVSEFIGISLPCAMLLKFSADPYPTAFLFTGRPGTGKTSFAFAMARLLGGEIHHISSQNCTVDAIREISYRCHTYPWSGRFHHILVDESDRMSGAAQLACLSKLDGSNPCPATIWWFTSNGTATLEERFTSRCKILTFDPPDVRELAAHLREIYRKESGAGDGPDFIAMAIAANGNVRTAVQSLEMELLVPGSFRVKTVPLIEQSKMNSNTIHLPATCDRGAAARRAWETRRKRVA